MTYRWEPTTPLDRIMAAGFKRIDAAVDGVIDRLAFDDTFGGAGGQRYWKNQRARNLQAESKAQEIYAAYLVDVAAGTKQRGDPMQ